jgi:hypothetical protein
MFVFVTYSPTKLCLLQTQSYHGQTLKWLQIWPSVSKRQWVVRSYGKSITLPRNLSLILGLVNLIHACFPGRSVVMSEYSCHLRSMRLKDPQ